VPSPPTSPQPLPSRPTPPRSLRIFQFAYWALLFSFLAFVAWKLISGELVIIWENPWLGSFAMLATAFFFMYRYTRAQVIRNFLSPHSGFICPRCHYGLRALPDEGTCPECGTTYTRASIVALWEHTYRLGQRYPRVSARSATDATPSAAQTSTSQSTPWSKWNLGSALTAVESGARRRGFKGARMPSLAMEFDAACAKLAHPLPADLHAFLAAFDPALWSRFIHTWPAQAPAPSTSVTDNPLSAWLATTPEITEHIRIRRPAELVVATLAEHAATHPGARAFADSLWTSTRSPAWEHTQLIAFADAHSSETLFYCTNPPDDLPRGCIITFFSTSPDRAWLADSFSQWLTRLACCEGVDGAFPGPGLDRAPKQLLDTWLAEFNTRNASNAPHTAA
jgi:hypothetical protein